MVEVTITGKTKLLGVIGYPIKHSLSPVMHNAAIAQMGVDYVYVPLPVQPEDLQLAIAGFTAIGLVGFSITIPHKQAIIPFLTEVSPIAQAIGAVNTVWRTENGWMGTNTDVDGFLAPLQNPNLDRRGAEEQRSRGAEEQGCRGERLTDTISLSSSGNGRDWSQTVAVILGCGGAARAVVAGCHQLGCAEIHVVGRNQHKLKDFAASWRHSPLPVDVLVYDWQDLPDLIAKADLLVNTTPVGMYPHVDESPVSAAEMGKLRQSAIAYDLIYTPNPTQFLKMAQEAGAIAIDGLEMLVQQGAVALQIWLQQPVPVEVMRQSLRQHLGIL